MKRKKERVYLSLDGPEQHTEILVPPIADFYCNSSYQVSTKSIIYIYYLYIYFSLACLNNQYFLQ